MKNSAYRSGIKGMPYAAMFGTEPRVGLTFSSLPSEIVERLQTKDDLLAILNTPTEITTEPEALITQSMPDDLTLWTATTETESATLTPDIHHPPCHP
ncbi:hypothetical protein LSAT2_016873 [Lamellibrachia satsuma]|nr:hypothetical protein LSAT2_016873 [Lamellibrachia satsuma]